ncbi:MAG: rhodanese-like domain-containing protein [Armatimonadota bacterium]
MRVEEITVEELKRKLDDGEDVLILDVRDKNEYDVCNIGGQLIPLGELASRLSEVGKGKPIVVHCKGGGRSAKAVEFMQKNGYGDVKNLAGGISAWVDRIDPSMARYW